MFFDSLLRYYMCVDPESLPDEKWAWTIRFLLEIRMMENKANGSCTEVPDKAAGGQRHCA